VGPYDTLPATWGRLLAWAGDRALEPGGPPWESYLDDPDLVDAALLRSELVQPVRS
jgi:effector-binding domain-containing protein